MEQAFDRPDHQEFLNTIKQQIGRSHFKLFLRIFIPENVIGHDERRVEAIVGRGEHF